MPILKVRQTNDTWYEINKLTLDELDLGNDIVLSSETNGGNKLFVVNGEKILDQGDYDTLNGLIGTNTTNIGAIKEKLTEFYEINSTDGKLNLTNYLKKENKRIHAFVNFNKKEPDITYDTDNCIVKGDDIGALDKAGVCEMDAYYYNEKFYIIWKNWG